MISSRRFDTFAGSTHVLPFGREFMTVMDPAAAAGAAAIVGHIYPVWLRFHGGKGGATATGVILALDPIAIAAGVIALGFVGPERQGLLDELGVRGIIRARPICTSPVPGGMSMRR